MSFSTCSCVLCQKDQRSGSSFPIFLTGVLASGCAPPWLNQGAAAFQLHSRPKLPLLDLRASSLLLTVSHASALLNFPTPPNFLPMLRNNLVDQSVLLRLRRGHNEIPLHVLLQCSKVVMAVLGHQLVD